SPSRSTWVARGMASVTDAARPVKPSRTESSSWWKLRRRSMSLIGTPPRSSEPSRDVVLGPGVGRVGEDLLRDVELDEAAGAAVTLFGHLGGEEGGPVADARPLLHVLRDGNDRGEGPDFPHEILDPGRRDRVERRARLVHEDDLGLHGDGAGDAEPLLLAARHPERRRLQAVLDLVPEGRAPQGPLDDVVELALLADAVDLRAERDVVVDALRERVRPLEDHPDAPADFGRRDVRSVQVDAVVHQRALDPSGGDEVV